MGARSHLSSSFGLDLYRRYWGDAYAYLANEGFSHSVVLLWSAGREYLQACQPLLNQLQSRLDLTVFVLPRESVEINADTWLQGKLELAQRFCSPRQTLVCGSPALLEIVRKFVPQEELRSDLLAPELPTTRIHRNG